jgi:hypothetical protein
MGFFQDLSSAASGDLVPALVLFSVGLLGVIVPMVGLVAYHDLRRRHARLPAWTRLEHLEAEVARREQDHAAELARLETLRTQVADAEQRRAARDAAVADLEEVRKRLTDLNERLAALDPRRAELASLEAQLQDRQRAVQEAETRLTTLAEHTAGLQGALMASQTNLDGLETRITQRKAELDGVTAELARHRQEAQEAHAATNRARDERDQATTKLAETQRAVAAAEARFLALKAEVASLEGLKTTLERWLERAQERESADQTEAVFADLFQPPAMLTGSALTKPTRNANEREALAQLADHVRTVGLRFSERRLHAFHTSLKTASLSPLTVLAGISGTGKSELPRRYAEGMGFHFLQMAVQPRWDSPQDLFGFYNYLEKRFVATDLARALVHLDARNHPKAAGPFAERMLVVLLDEMNLARVEYYFSEFLSRLEVRRSVDANDARSRQPAEIVLETGGAGARPVRIFPGTNVLFVGTMNEDESTQTLSDKVNDRANVIRFGRPASLAGAAPSAVGSPANAFLAEQHWAAWQRTADALKPNDLERLAGWIGTVNDALQRLGRPFGHRVNQAILAYVANHPLFDKPQGVEVAFADQLEQRVLPKLRGIEHEDETARDALLAIHKLTQVLGDDLLAASIEQGMDAPLFQWSGVDRET